MNFLTKKDIFERLALARVLVRGTFTMPEIRDYLPESGASSVALYRAMDTEPNPASSCDSMRKVARP